MGKVKDRQADQAAIQGSRAKPARQQHRSQHLVDLDTAMQAYCAGLCDGIGFALRDSGYGALDLDDCVTDGVIHPWALAQIKKSGSYAETTPSNGGVRVIGLAAGAPVHRKFSVPNANEVGCELYRKADRYICVTGNQIGNATALASIDGQIDALLAELEEAKHAKGAKAAKEPGRGPRKRDLGRLIRDGCGSDFGGDRSRAVWYVINELLRQGRSAEQVVAILLDRANGISAHIYDQSKPEEYARRQVETAQKEGASTINIDAEIVRLAELTAVEFEHERKGAAERLNVRTTILDRLVQAERGNLGLDKGDSKFGSAISLAEPEPWPEPVEGAALLDALATAIRGYVVMADGARDTAALWAVHTFLLDCFLISPRLAVRSAVKRSGKTTLLDVLERLVFRPLSTENATSASIYRVIATHQPTILLDEGDTFLPDDDELRGVLNSGHRKGGSVLRLVGEDHEPRTFSTYSAVAIALNGRLADTLHDRSVVIDLKRRLASEHITRFRLDRTARLDVLARQAARWAQDHAEEIAAADPAMPERVFNREADNWRPLLAIADTAGGDWPQRARNALAQGHAADDDGALIEILLADIRDVFAEQRTAKIFSAELAEGLKEIEGRPWHPARTASRSVKTSWRGC